MASKARVKWDKTPSFDVQYSCRTYPRQKGAKFSSIVLGPFMNLVAFQWPMVVLLSWGLIFLYAYVFFAAIPPTVPLNSTDGQTIDTLRAGILTFIAWHITNMLIIGIMINSGSCNRLRDYVADYYLEQYTPDAIPDHLEKMADAYIQGGGEVNEGPRNLEMPYWLLRDLGRA